MIRKIQKRYDGGREVEDFIKYLAKESKLEGYDSTGAKKKDGKQSTTEL